MKPICTEKESREAHRLVAKCHATLIRSYGSRNGYSSINQSGHEVVVIVGTPKYRERLMDAIENAAEAWLEAK